MSQFSKFSLKFSPGTRILVAPLDWGLGHATRCIPLIHHLITSLKTTVLVAADGPQKAVISEAFPGIQFLSPPLYQIKYRKNRAATITGLALSIPRIFKTIQRERSWLARVVISEKIDIVISDNRYGMCNPGIPCYFITHQLLVKTPFGPLADRLVQQQLYRWINRFSECWIPDEAAGPGWAGELSHPVQLPAIPIRYMGTLSRLQQVPANADTQLLVLLSGPEPQRTLLENKIVRQWKTNPGESMVMVRGLPDTGAGFDDLGVIPNVIIYNHLPSDRLSQEVANARTILSRSGYSTIMDLLPAGRKCCMIPTPGQTEQEYLAAFLAARGLITTQQQHQLNLATLL